MKNNRFIRQTMTMLLALAMVFTMMPLAGIGVQAAYAETASANGGTVASNSKSGAVAAFGSDNVTAEYNSTAGTLTITLNSDITLKAPVKVKKGKSGDKVIIDLNGHTITAADGISGDSAEAAKGQDAIRIIPADYDVEIKGGGTVTGGKGAVIETGDHFRYGARGGDAVSFIADGNSYWNPQNNDAELAWGLTVTGGAVLTGGAGGDISGDDWSYSIDNYSGEKEHTLGDNGQFQLRAGAGGSGIGQPGTGIAYAQVLLAYAGIIIENGVVNGGSGGAVDMSTANTPVLTYYGLMNAPAIDGYMQELSNRDTAFDNYVDDATKLRPGRGGDAIMIGAGRKYLRVDQGSTVKGGRCGTMDYGSSKYVNCLSNEAADCGDGIGVYGDIGLKNVEPSLTESNMASKNAGSGDTGIYISGTVMGGSPAAAEAKHENGGNGGNGIYMQGEEEYFETDMRFPQGEDPVKWGIVAVDAAGKVCGGDASTAVYGSGGAGGHGICEGYTKGDDQTDDSRIGTDYYLIKGEAKGGKGGNSMISSGSAGGDGLSFANWRKNSVVIGGGSAAGGDSGKGADRMDDGDPIPGGQGVRYYPDNRDDLNNTVSLTEAEGKQSSKKTVSNTGLSVTAEMSSFSGYPSTSTQLSCTIQKPAGYNGGVYVTWYTEMKLQSNTSEVCEIEQPGTDNTAFKLLSNEQYKYLAYKTYPNIPDSDSISYNIDNIATVDRINYTIKHSNSWAEIYCTVQLEDGRWAKSNVMHFTSEGWKGAGGSGGSEGSQEQAAIDQAAADKAEELIEALPGLSNLRLSDEDKVKAARAAYDALTPAQKALLAPYTYLISDLEAAEARISELKRAEGSGDSDDSQEQAAIDQAAADKAEDLIEALPGLNNLTLADEDKVKAARTTYDALTPAQKELLAPYVYLKSDLEAAEARISELKRANGGVAEIVALIDELEDPSNISTPETANAQAGKIDAIREKIGVLSDDQQQILSNNETEALNKLAKVEGTVNDVLGKKHTHTMLHESARDATCVNDGNIEYYHCSSCGEYYYDKDGTRKIADHDKVIIGRDETKHVLRHVAASPATCLHTGTKEHYKCTECGKVFDKSKEVEIIDKNSLTVPVDLSKHKWDGGIVTRAATTAQTGIKTYTCTICGTHRNETIDKLSGDPGKGGSGDAAAKVKKVKTVTVNTAKVNSKVIDKAVKKAGGSYKYVTKIVLGKKVKTISKNSFKKYKKTKTLVVKTKKLKKATVKNSLKGSKVTKIQVKVGSKKVNKKYVKKYKTIFTKKNAGRKVKVSL